MFMYRVFEVKRLNYRDGILACGGQDANVTVHTDCYFWQRFNNSKLFNRLVNSKGHAQNLPIDAKSLDKTYR